jgi:hypothetical protein
MEQMGLFTFDSTIYTTAMHTQQLRKPFFQELGSSFLYTSKKAPF